MTTLAKTIDGVMNYRGICGNRAQCRLRVYEAPKQETVALASELPNNQGTSIVCMVESLAERVWQMIERPATGLLWVEHIPEVHHKNGYVQRETFSIVTFRSTMRPFSQPYWTQVHKDLIISITGDAFNEQVEWQSLLRNLPEYALDIGVLCNG